MMYLYNDVENQVMTLTYRQSLLFAFGVVKRLYPNYLYFLENSSFKAKGLDEVIDYLHLFIFNKEQANIKELAQKKIVVENCMPYPEDFDTILASSALDASGVVYELINYILDKEQKRIKNICIMSFDTIEMYIQDRENLPSNFDEKIINQDILMQKEVSFQNELLKKVKNMKRMTYSEIRGSLEL